MSGFLCLALFLLCTPKDQNIYQIFFFNFLAPLYGMQDLSSPTRVRALIPGIGSPESLLLDHQESPSIMSFIG